MLPWLLGKNHFILIQKQIAQNYEVFIWEDEQGWSILPAEKQSGTASDTKSH